MIKGIKSVYRNIKHSLTYDSKITVNFYNLLKNYFNNKRGQNYLGPQLFRELFMEEDNNFLELQNKYREAKKSIDDSYEQLKAYLETITTLDLKLYDPILGDGGFELLAKILKTNNKIKVLRLYIVDDEGFKVLINMLKVNTTLQYISIETFYSHPYPYRKRPHIDDFIHVLANNNHTLLEFKVSEEFYSPLAEDRDIHNQVNAILEDPDRLTNFERFKLMGAALPNNIPGDVIGILDALLVSLPHLLPRAIVRSMEGTVTVANSAMTQQVLPVDADEQKLDAVVDGMKAIVVSTVYPASASSSASASYGASSSASASSTSSSTLKLHKD